MSQSNGWTQANNSTYTLLGTGPLTASLVDNNSVVSLIVGPTTAPDPSAVGTIMSADRMVVPVANAQQVWAISKRVNTVNIDVLVGTPAAPSSGGSSTSEQLDITVMNYKVLTAGTNMAVGDLLQQNEVWNTTSSMAVYVGTIWRNLTQEVQLSVAPSAANITPLSASATTVSVSNMPGNLAQETGGNLAAILAKLGTTLAISATALPLPTNAAQETGGNLAAVAAGVGTTADAAYAGTGSSSVIAALKGVYNRVAAVAGLLAGNQSAPGTAQTVALTVQGNSAGIALPTVVNPSTVTYTDRSGSITTAATSQTLMAANTSRKRVIIHNPASASAQGISAAESLFINFTSAAGVSGGSIELLPGGTYESDSITVSSELITVYAATATHKYTAKEA